MNDKFAVCIGKGGQRDQAESFARKTESIIADKPGKNLTVLFDSKGISLTGYGLTYQGDFENMLHRVTNGRLQHEMLVRAAKSEKEGRKAIDATAGLPACSAGIRSNPVRAESGRCCPFERRTAARKETSDIEGNRSPDETGRGRQRRMYVQTSGSGRCYLPRSQVPGTTEIQPHQQEATADPET